MAWGDWYQLALVFRRWGWVCIPLDGNKKPVGQWKGLQNRKPDDIRLGKLFAYKPGIRGLGVLLGRASGRRGHGLAVRDFDTLDGYREWAQAYPKVAEACPTVRTRRGAHVYFWNAGKDMFLEADKARLPFGAGDLRADPGHFAVLPPSVHPAGGTYRWMWREPASADDIPTFTPAAAGLVAPVQHQQARPTAQLARLSAPLHRPVEWDARDEGGALPPAVREAVLRSQPRGPGERHRRLFDLAQRLLDVAPGVPAGYWSSAFGLWWRVAEPVVGTKDRETSWRDFTGALKQAQTPTSLTAPRQAIRQAGGPSEGAEEANTSCVHSDPATAILGAGRRLAALSPDGVFHLSVRLAGEAAGLGKSRAAELLKELVASGKLVVVGEPARPSATCRLATQYRLGYDSAGAGTSPPVVELPR